MTCATIALQVQHVLLQLGQTNLVVCNWLNNFAAENPPYQGDKFVLKLMQQVRRTPKRSAARVRAPWRLLKAAIMCMHA